MAKNRKRFRRSSRKGRSRKSTGFAAKVADALASPETYTQEIGTVIFLAASSTTYGTGCTYRTSDIDVVGGGSTITNGNSLFGVNHLLRIAANLNAGAGNLSEKYFITHALLSYNLTNQNNFRVLGTAWYCKVRRDLGNTGAQDDAVHMLNDGFIRNGYGTDANTLGLRQSELTPYQSSSYVTSFNITRRRRFQLKAGATRIFNLKSSRRWRVNPQVFIIPHDQTVTWLTATKGIAWAKGDRFILFQLAGQSCINDGSVTGLSTSVGVLTLRTINRIGYKVIHNNVTHIQVQPSLGIATSASPEFVTEFTALPSIAASAG